MDLERIPMELASKNYREIQFYPKLIDFFVDMEIDFVVCGDWCTFVSTSNKKNFILID